MHPSQRARTHQQNQVIRHSANHDSYTFFNLLTGPQFLDQVESLLPEHRERLFEPFFTAVPGGTGLGLYIARQLCEANNATLELVPGNGEARFRIIFEHVEVNHEAA